MAYEITVTKDGETLFNQVLDQTQPPSSTTTTTVPVTPLNLYRAPQQVDSFVAANPVLKTIADVPAGKWLGEWTGDVKAAVSQMAKDAKGQAMVLIAYNVPGRDNGNYSSGGAGSPEAYKQWIDALAAGIGNAPAIVILEPDGLGLAVKYPTDQLNVRLDLIAYAVKKLSSLKACHVWIDASTWVEPEDMASMLKLVAIGAKSAVGFSCNVSGYMPLDKVRAWAEKVSMASSMTYVVDTSRNGVGGNDGDWCNPVGQGLGMRPRLITDGSAMFAALWLKAPGESDGTCNGGPSAGTFWLERALELIKNDAFPPTPTGSTTTTTTAAGQPDTLAKVKAIASVYGDHLKQMNEIRALFGIKPQ